MSKYEEMAKEAGLSGFYIDRAKNIDLFGHDNIDQVYKKLLTTAAQRANVSETNIEELMDIVAFHETGQTMDPSLIHNNAGRGLFGYEIGEESDVDGKYINASGSARTAMNRVYSAIGGKLTTYTAGKAPTEIPKFIEEYFSGTNPQGDVDVSAFTALQQKILFLADHLEAGDFDDSGARLLRVGDLPSWWGEFHKRAGTPDYDLFRENMKDYNRNKKNN